MDWPILVFSGRVSVEHCTAVRAEGPSIARYVIPVNAGRADKFGLKSSGRSKIGPTRYSYLLTTFIRNDHQPTLPLGRIASTTCWPLVAGGEIGLGSS